MEQEVAAQEIYNLRIKGVPLEYQLEHTGFFYVDKCGQLDYLHFRAEQLIQACADAQSFRWVPQREMREYKTVA